MTAITVTLEESIITVTPIVETQTIIIGGGGSGSGAVNLNGLADVAITTPTTGQVLKFDGTKFVNANDEIGGNLSLDNLTDVVITSPTSGQVLKFNGTNFINDTDYSVSTLNDLSDVTIAALEVGQVLKYDGVDFKNAFDDNVLRQYVHNASGNVLLKGKAVYVSGSQGQRVTVGLAQANGESTSSKTIGIVQNDISANGNGYIVTEGMITNIDTSGAINEGDAVYLSPTVAGGFVYGYSNHPVAPNHLVYIGIVVRKHASTGSILVKVQNGFEIDELHDVLIVSPTNRQVIGYDSVSSIWKNQTLPSYEVFTEGLTLIVDNKIQLTHKPEGNLVLNMAMVYDANDYTSQSDLYNNVTVTNVSTTYYATFSVTGLNGKYGVVSYLRRIN
jgi:hypothetical protein